MSSKLILLLLLCCAPFAWSQDRIVFDDQGKLLNQSVADRFTIYESEDNALSPTEFLEKKTEITSRKLDKRLENLDFTTSSYFIRFTVVNKTNARLNLMLETARPITNEVVLFNEGDSSKVISGDGIPFHTKTVPSNHSILPLSVDANGEETYVLKLTSDGETLALPMIFRKAGHYDGYSRTRQWLGGIFYGIFFFVIVIYLTFFVLLRERLFLLYVIYVLFSGLLQMALDGYIHQYLLPSGGYLTQHSVMFVAGVAVLFALSYATRYLELKGRYRTISNVLFVMVAATTAGSLFPGVVYEIAYPMINGFSFLAMSWLLVAAFLIRKKSKVNRLFFVGLSSLVLGGLIFILGNFGVIDAPEVTQLGLKAGTLMEIIFLSILMAGRYKSLQEEKEMAQKRLVEELEAKNILISETNVRLEQEVAERTKEIELQRLLLKEKNEDFVASVKYAERIQSAVLSNEGKFKSILPDSFVMFRPKDIVSGDFYWVETIEPTDEWPNGLLVYATADCTGHGVPGALVSIIGNHLLKLGKTHKDVQSPGDALDFLNKEINLALNSKYGQEQIRDGMDVTLCAIDQYNMQLFFAGAQNSAYIVRAGELHEIKGDRMSIGSDGSDKGAGFTTHQFTLQKGDVIYTYSDGYADQFGGPKEKKFMSKRLKTMLMEIGEKPMNEQQEIVENAFDEWKGDLEQLDDVLLIGVRI